MEVLFCFYIHNTPIYHDTRKSLIKKKKIKGKQKVLSNNNNEEIQNVLF